MAHKKVQRYVADFETTTDPADVRVWAACAVNIETLETEHISNSIDAFFEWLKDKNTVVYFHNLKFDGEFILAYLLRNGFKHDDTREPGTFDTLIADNGQFYSITVIFEKKNKKYKKVVFYDSLKKLPFKVSVISKAFNLEDEKLSIDYDAPRPIGHELTEEEKRYIVNDCRIVAAALQIQFGQGLKRMTNASDALNSFKDIIGKKQFDHLFPTLPIELDADIRRAYKGGFVYLKPEHQNRRGLKGMTLDVNSLYPWAMYYNVLPYGYPMYFEGYPNPDEIYCLFIVRLECSFELKPGHLPTIQLKNNRAFVETEYLTSSDGDIVEMTLTSVDLQLFLEHYDVYDLTYHCGWKFKGMTGIFDEYIDTWMAVKENNTGALRQLAKLMLNSLYGKFATNPNAAQKVPVYDHDGVVQYLIEDDEPRDPVYTAMAAFITAYARDKTIRSGQAVFDRFIYADTDSLHLIGDTAPKGLFIHPTKLGAWKDEGHFCDSKYIRAKTYMESMVHTCPASLRAYATLLDKVEWISQEDGVITYAITTVTCAGMPDNLKEMVTYENFTPGSRFFGKLVPRRFPGGVILMPTTFTLM